VSSAAGLGGRVRHIGARLFGWFGASGGLVAQGWRQQGALVVARNLSQLSLTLLSIVGILAAGDAFILHRPSVLERSIETTTMVQRNVVRSVIRAEGVQPDTVLPSLPTAIVGGKEVYVCSFPLLTKLYGFDQAGIDPYKANLSQNNPAPNPALQYLSQSARQKATSDPCISEIANGVSQVYAPPVVQHVVDQVTTSGTTYSVLIEVTNTGNGESGPIQVELPSKVTVDDPAKRWTILHGQATISSLKPQEAADLVLSANEKFDVKPESVTLSNSSGVVADHFWPLVLSLLAISTAVVLWDLRSRTGRAKGRG